MQLMMQQTTGHIATHTLIPIHGAEGRPVSELRLLMRDKGYRCVRFECCVSVLVATFRCQTEAYLTDSARTRFLYGLAYSLLALATGPWGLPWGPYFTGRAIWKNLRGGEDVTEQVLSSLEKSAAAEVPDPHRLDQ